MSGFGERMGNPASRQNTDRLTPYRFVLPVLLIAVFAILVHVSLDSPAITLTTVLVTTILSSMAVNRMVQAASIEQQKRGRQHHDALTQSQAKWDLLNQESQQATLALSKMREGVVMLSTDHQILLINPAAKDLFNLVPEQDYLGRTFEEVVRLPTLIQMIASVTSEPKSVLVEVAGRKRVRPVRVWVDRVHTIPIGGLMITLRDETEAQQVDEIRREFVANISHELKTPLAAIKGYAETIELAIDDDPKSATHFVGQINTQCLRLERLIADMMQLARAQAGREHLNFNQILISDVIAEALKSYRPIAEKKQIELIVAKVADVSVLADSDATLTIANNLIGNAIHYTPSGGRVTVSCRQETDRGVLVVADTGVGIPQEEQSRIFERFYRVEKNRGSESGGTGIGLSMVKNLVQTMGGTVRLQSQPGQGTTFEVSLPRC